MLRKSNADKEPDPDICWVQEEHEPNFSDSHDSLQSGMEGNLGKVTLSCLFAPYVAGRFTEDSNFQVLFL